jgi:hypothetical protein
MGVMCCGEVRKIEADESPKDLPIPDISDKD